MAQHVLLAVDESPASRRAAEYVGKLLRVQPNGRRAGDRASVALLHIYPPHLASQYATGQALARELSRPKYEFELARDRNVAAQALEFCRPTDEARELLLKLGVPRDAITVHHAEAGPTEDAAQIIIKYAAKLGCDTIALGRTSDHRLLRGHLSDAVIKVSAGFAVWVVQ